MLDVLDKELESRELHFVRYADDCIILVRSGKAADRVMANVSKFIEKRLELKVNITKSKISKPNDIKYLGFGFYKDRQTQSYKVKPHKISVTRLKERLKNLTSRKWSVAMENRLLKIKQLITGWINYYRIGNYKGICMEIDANLRFRLRMCLWKQWKKIKKRHKELVKLGIPFDKAQSWANTRKGYARSASSFLQVAITNEELKKRGLVSLSDQYQLRHI